LWKLVVVTVATTNTTWREEGAVRGRRRGPELTWQRKRRETYSLVISVGMVVRERKYLPGEGLGEEEGWEMCVLELEEGVAQEAETERETCGFHHPFPRLAQGESGGSERREVAEGHLV
jgi:hypothetical protein